MLGRSSFQNAIFSGRILDLRVKVGLSPRYSSLSVENWGQGTPNGVGLLGFLAFCCHDMLVLKICAGEGLFG